MLLAQKQLLGQKSLLISPTSAVHQISDATTEQKQKNYSRTIVNLSGKELVWVPRNQPLQRFEQYGILPLKKYTFEVYLQVGYLVKTRKLSPQEIAEYMREKFPSLDQAHLGKDWIKSALKLLSQAVLPYLPKLAPSGSWTLMLDGTIKKDGEFTLMVSLMVPLQKLPDQLDSKADLDSQLEKYPLSSHFLPSENEDDIKKLLNQLKSELPTQPYAVMSDYSEGILGATAQVFPNSLHLGCQFHALQIVARVMLDPLQREIRRKLKGIVSKLKTWSRSTKYNWQVNSPIREMALLMNQLLNQGKGNFGQNLCKMLEKLMELHNWLISSKVKPFAEIPAFLELKKLFESPIWQELGPLLKELEKRCRNFEHLRRILRSPAKEDPSAQLEKLILQWERKSEEWLNQAAVKLQELKKYLKPALQDDRLPRSTSALEGLHGLVKKVMRHWKGTRKIPDSFDWVAPILSVLESLDDLQNWENLLAEISAEDWVSATVKLRKTETQRRLETKKMNQLSKLSPKELIDRVHHSFNLYLIEEGL